MSGSDNGQECLSGLTGRQQQIAALVGHGLANKEIAERLRLSVGTVKVHLHAIFQKLGIRCRSQLMFFSLNGSGRVGPLS